jgi:hypothetical protein
MISGFRTRGFSVGFNLTGEEFAMMLKRVSVFFLFASVLIHTQSWPVLGQSGQATQNVKTEVARRGVNLKKKVRVKMADGTKKKGFISAISDDGFTLLDSKTKAASVLAYRDVSKVEGPGLAGGARVGIIVAAVSGATLLALYVAFLNATRNN